MALAEEAAIEAAWRWFRDNRDTTDIPFAAVVAVVRARCPSVELKRIRFSFERRLRALRRFGTTKKRRTRV